MNDAAAKPRQPVDSLRNGRASVGRSCDRKCWRVDSSNSTSHRGKTGVERNRTWRWWRLDYNWHSVCLAIGGHFSFTSGLYTSMPSYTGANNSLRVRKDMGPLPERLGLVNFGATSPRSLHAVERLIKRGKLRILPHPPSHPAYFLLCFPSFDLTRRPQFFVYQRLVSDLYFW